MPKQVNMKAIMTGGTLWCVVPYDDLVIDACEMKNEAYRLNADGTLWWTEKPLLRDRLWLHLPCPQDPVFTPREEELP